MERDCKRKKIKKERENFVERSPLKHLNGDPIQRRYAKKSSDSSSSSAPAFSRFHRSSSTTHLLKKPKISSEISKMEFRTPRFGENETPRKPFLQKSRKNTPQFTMQNRNSNSDANPTCSNRQRSKLSSFHGISQSREKKGSQEFSRVSNGTNSSIAENGTPVSVRVASNHESAIDDPVYERGSADNATDVKTPPVEASLSPEIQSQSQSKMAAINSVGTPVCYGAGHLLSGVSDRRKWKRRGSLKGCPGKAIPFSDENVSVDMQKSSIPLLSEASVRWHLSPSDFEHDLDKYGDDLCTIDLLSSLDFLCSNSRVRNNGTTSPRKSMEFQGFFDDSKLITSPKATYTCNAIRSKETNCVSESMTEDCSDTEFDSITETLERLNLSTTSETSMWGVPGLGSHSADNGSPSVSLDPTRLQKDADSVFSWVSNATSDDPTLSQMRMSWCEGLIGADDFDCCYCCCLSDEQIDGDERVEEKETVQCDSSRHMVVASVGNKGNGLGIGNELSQVLLDYKPCLTAEGKGNSLRNNACAESICTNGGGLLVSDDSDWTYFR